jgi:hypothetical protein
MPKLTSKAVHDVFVDCLFLPAEIHDGKPPADAILVEGIMMNVGFHPGRLEGHRAEVEGFLAELPDVFKDGMTFLNMAEDRHGNLWGEHRNMEQLVLLAIGLKRMAFCMPKALWSAFPGGMPYVQVLTPKEPDRPHATVL